MLIIIFLIPHCSILSLLSTKAPLTYMSDLAGVTHFYCSLCFIQSGYSLMTSFPFHYFFSTCFICYSTYHVLNFNYFSGSHFPFDCFYKFQFSYNILCLVHFLELINHINFKVCVLKYQYLDCLWICFVFSHLFFVFGFCLCSPVSS